MGTKAIAAPIAEIEQRVRSLSPEELKQLAALYAKYHRDLSHAARGVYDYLADLHEAAWLRYTFVMSPPTFRREQLVRLTSYFLELVLSYEISPTGDIDAGSHFIFGRKDAGIESVKASLTALATCKASLSRPIGPSPVARFYRACAERRVTTGFFIAIGKFSPEARGFLEAQRHNLYSGRNVVLIAGDEVVTASSFLSQVCDVLIEIHAVENRYAEESCSLTPERRKAKIDKLWDDAVSIEEAAEKFINSCQAA